MITTQWMDILVKKDKSRIQTNTLSDEALIHRIADKDEAAFEELSRRFLHRAWQFDMQFLQNQDDANDAVQEKFMRVWRSADRFESRDGSRVSNYLLKIDKNICLDMLSRAARKYEMTVGDLLQDDDADDPDALFDYLAFNHWTTEGEGDDFTGAESKELLDQILSFTRESFSPAQFLCFWGFVSGMTYREISATYHLNHESVRGYITRGFKRVRNEFAKEVSAG